MSAEPFVDGVASGDPTASSIVLWTRAPDLDELTWTVVGRDGSNHSGTVAVDHERDHTVHLLVEDLAPGTTHEYRFTAPGHASAVGRFRTLDPDASTVQFAVVTCAKFNSGYFHAYRAIADRDDLDFVLHLGDYVYEAANVPPRSQTPGAGIGRDFEPLHECRTLEDYRLRYRQYRRDPDLRHLHERHALIVTLDDHELADNAWRLGAQEHRDDRDGPWSTRLAAALQAWEEWQPTLCQPTQGKAIHRSVELGRSGRLLVTETRTNRDPRGDRPTQLGPEQQTWIEAGTADPGTTGWLVLAVPSSLAPFWAGAREPVAAEAMQTLKLVEPDGSGPFHDLWDGFGTERAEVLAALAARGGRRLVLSGDVHVAMETELTTADGRFAAMDCTAPSVTSANLDDKRGWSGTDRSTPYADAMVRAVPGLRWCDLDAHGFVTVELRDDAAAVSWWGTFAVTDPIAPLRRLRTSVFGSDGRPAIS